jgi:hypothetical protein
MTPDQASDIMVRVGTAILGTEEALRLASMVASFPDPDYIVSEVLEGALDELRWVRDHCQKVIKAVEP